jgi:hypothetical protein
MDFIQIITGKFILIYIGGTLRYIYGTIWRTIFNKPKYTFKEYINGPKKGKNWYDEAHQQNNVMIAFIFIMTIIFITTLL